MAKKRKTNKSSKRSTVAQAATSKAARQMPMMTARQLTITFVLWFIAHSLVFYLANRFFPSHIVLGTNQFSAFQSLMYSMVVFTLLVVGAAPVIEHLAVMKGKVLRAMDWMVLYFVLNAISIWVVARFAEQLGLGISSWVVAVIMAAIVDIVQGILVSKVN